MRPRGPRSWLLNGRIGWKTWTSCGVSVGHGAPIELGARCGGPLALDSRDGSLGGLLLPRGVAWARDGLYWADPERCRILRLDPETATFERVPGLGGRTPDARGLEKPTRLAAAGPDLLVLDEGEGARTVKRFVLGSWALRSVLASVEDGGAGHPADVWGDDEGVWILDAGSGAVLRIDEASDRARRVFALPGPAERWTRIARDRNGGFLCFDAPGHRVHRFDGSGRSLGQVTEAAALRSFLEPPPVWTDDHGRLRVPRWMTAAGCEAPRRSAATHPLASPRVPGEDDLAFAPGGLPAHPDPAEPRAESLLLECGKWVSAPLDSQIHRCPWHRIELDLGALPPGTALEVATLTWDRDSLADVDSAFGSQPPWAVCRLLSAPIQPRSAEPAPVRDEFLVQSPPGRYLWVRLELRGDGYATPRIEQLRIHYPRDSYLRHLPAIYADDDAGRAFLERFLAVAQTEWESIETRGKALASHLDPETAPEPWLDTLARWLGVPLDATWTAEGRRSALQVASAFAGRRGTPEALRRMLRARLADLTGLDESLLADWPRVTEDYTARAAFRLGAGELSERIALAPRDSRSRVRLDAGSRLDEARIVSHPDPKRDEFHAHAHGFSVFVPASLVADREAELALCRLLDQESPAHACWELQLVEAEFRVGVYASVGVDTIVGGTAPAELAPDEDDPRPRRKTAARLGANAVVGRSPGSSPPFGLDRATRLGVNSKVK